MLHASFRITGPIHVRHERHVLNAQTIDDNVRMNIAAVVMTVWMRDDHCLMPGKMLLAKLHSESLRLIDRQPMILCIPGIKAENIVMTFHIAAGCSSRIADSLSYKRWQNHPLRRAECPSDILLVESDARVCPGLLCQRTRHAQKSDTFLLLHSPRF